MGSVASARFPLEDIARPSLRPACRGNRCVGFPLGVASAGTAILALLPEAEQEELLRDWARHAGTFTAGHPEELVRANLEQTRLKGYSVNPGRVLEGSWGMGAAVFDQSGRPDPLSRPGWVRVRRRRAAFLVPRAVVLPSGATARRGAPPDPHPSTRCQKW
ncbi:MAG: IclR family transcriptional regulator [Pseudarthrobacter sp.]|nr:IclR family transcriptional regulator [Pseudarthrobacter sp.]